MTAGDTRNAVALCIAADRMRDGWADGDARYRNALWVELHDAADRFRDGRTTDELNAL